MQFEKTTVRKAQELIREWDKMWKEHCRMLEENAPGQVRILSLRARAAGDGGKRKGGKGTAAQPHSHGWKRKV